MKVVVILLLIIYVSFTYCTFEESAIKVGKFVRKMADHVAQNYDESKIGKHQIMLNVFK